MPDRNLYLINQMAGPLFQETAIGLASKWKGTCYLVTGHPDTIKYSSSYPKNLSLVTGVEYDKSTMLRRLITWLIFAISSLKVFLESKKDDVFLIVSNPPFLAAIIWLASRIKRRDYFVLIYDVHPDLLISLGTLSEHSFLAKVWRWFNRKAYRDSIGVITLGSHMEKVLSQYFERGVGEIAVIPPWVDTNKILPIDKNVNPLRMEINPENKFVVLYSGNMGFSHDIESMLNAALLLKSEKDILFLFVGNGPKWRLAQEFKVNNELSNIHVLPFQNEDRAPNLMALADISLVSLEAGAEGKLIPSKVFSYLAAGSAVIGVCSDNNDLRDIIQKTRSGVCVNPGDPKALAREIMHMWINREELNIYKKNARESVVENFSKEKGILAFQHLFKSHGYFK